MSITIDPVKLAAGDLDYELTQTRRVLAAVPDDKFDHRPHPKAWSMGGLANHLAQLPGLFSATVRTSELDFAKVPKQEPATNTAGLLAIFDHAAAEARAAYSELTPEMLVENWTFRVGEKVFFTRPKADTFRSFTISHMIHHRAQLTIYLREVGARVPGMYGPTADDV